VLNALPSVDSLLVLAYHRVGNPAEEEFDPGLFDSTQELLDEQLRYLKRQHSLVSLDEAIAFVNGGSREKTERCRVLVTFDDGYLDNYRIVYPVMKSHSVEAVFFLVSDLVGTSTLTWWEQIAFMVRNSRNRRFKLRYPTDLDVDLDSTTLSRSLNSILNLYKRPDAKDKVEFFKELRKGTGSDDPPAVERRFLDWKEAEEMVRGGMAVGSHTVSHPLLSQLDVDGQLEELTTSKRVIEDKLKIRVRALAYPVGLPTSFTNETRDLARRAGYEVAFSYYGGTNLRDNCTPYDIRRVSRGGESQTRFFAQAAICRATGKWWP